MIFCWNDLGWVFEDYPAYENDLKRPDNLAELYDVAENLAKDFLMPELIYMILKAKCCLEK